MNSPGSKLAAVLLSFVLLAYVGYQAYAAFYKPYETEIVTIGHYVQDVNLEGFFVRDEVVLSAKKTGVVRYNYENADKVPKNAVIASFYDSENDLYNIRRMETLERQREILNQAQDRESVDGMKVDLLNKQNSATKLKLLTCVDSGDLTELDAVVEELMLGLDRFQAFVDKDLTYQSTVDSVSAEIETLRASIPQEKGTVTSDESGYFASLADGYEGIFTPELLEDLTVAQVEQFLEERETGVLDNVGKLLRDNRWYFVALMSEKDGERFGSAYENGWNVKLKFSSQSSREVTARIEEIISEDQKTVIVFSSTYLDGDFAVMRFETPKAVIADYSGIIIPKEAVRIRKETDGDGNEQNVKGVYVQVGDSTRFKKADVIYEDSYVLISQPNVSEDYVANYDQVIIRGKDLGETSG